MLNKARRSGITGKRLAFRSCALHVSVCLDAEDTSQADPGALVGEKLRSEEDALPLGAVFLWVLYFYESLPRRLTAIMQVLRGCPVPSICEAESL